ncbi:MAG: AraC family transcriptional regulator [Prevotella sp.]|nr:AraC family transcriptional regulator [Prevotella sp.]
MYSLKEYWHLSSHPMPNGAWDGNVACVVYDAKKVLKTNETRGFLAGYGFNFVLRGSMTIIYNNIEMTIQEGDLYTYSPGFEIRVPSASADFLCLSLLVDEQFALSLPSVRDAIRMAHFPLVELTAPVLPTQAEERRRLQELMQMMMHYQQAGLPQMNESLKMLFNLFLLDLSAIQEHSIREHHFPKRVEEIFLDFLHLLPQHFAEHHDIGFYADRLCITTTYLSRVVRQVSGGRTVIDYINQLLLMEAMFLLRQTSLSVAQIADRLHFAETTTFARFFHRMKGVTPKEFRKG